MFGVSGVGRDGVIIFYAMAVLKSMKETSDMTKIYHLKVDFVKRITGPMKGYHI